MRPIINAKIRLLSELTEHTIANEIEAPHEVLRKEFQGKADGNMRRDQDAGGK